MRHSIGKSKGNKINRASLLPVWETIGRKTDIFVRIEKLEVIHRVGTSLPLGEQINKAAL
jgi:hypothetical protein